MKLQRKTFARNPTAIDRAKAQTLLLWLGVPRKDVISPRKDVLSVPNKLKWSCRYNTFWGRNEWELLGVLEKAKLRHRYLMATAHPDRNGSHDDCVAINLIWSKLKRLFESHGILP